MKNSRRQFVKQSTRGFAAISLASVLPLQGLAVNRKVWASEKVNFGVIGCKGMGWSDMRSHLLMDDVECIALCDVDQSVLDERAGQVTEARGKKPQTYGDYRKLLDNKDIDAVIIGTPDHWHCRIMVDALEAGKHVYVEKPIANSIEECNIMLAAARKHGKVVQVGQWQRSGDHYQKAYAYLKTGVLGNIRLVKTWAYQGWMNPVPMIPDSAPPAGVDYKMWLGPAPDRPFNKNRFHFNFRWFWDYAGGLMTDWGCTKSILHSIIWVLWRPNPLWPQEVN